MISINKGLAAFGFCLFLTASSASAAMVQYSTLGSFDNVSFTPTASISFGTTTLNYTNAVVDAPGVSTPTNISLGRFQVTSTSATPDALSGNFYLRIMQVAPEAGSANLPATIAGSISFNSSTGYVQFDSTSASIDGVTYNIANAAFGNPGRVVLIAPNVNSGAGLGTSTIEGSVSAVPEPATYAMLGGGLLSLAALRRRVQN